MDFYKVSSPISFSNQTLLIRYLKIKIKNKIKHIKKFRKSYQHSSNFNSSRHLLTSNKHLHSAFISTTFLQ